MVPTAVSLVPTLASLGGCELSLERRLQPLHLKPAVSNNDLESPDLPSYQHFRPSIRR
jgi:hypothetical protein